MQRMTTPAETAYGMADGGHGAIKQMVMEHLHLVRVIVDRASAGLQPGVSQEDLISAGTLGLVEAAHRFDPSMGVQFVTFAYQRVKGAVIDFLRDNDQLSKSARGQVTMVRRGVREFREANGRKPSVGELARQAAMSEQDVLKYLSYEKWDHVGSLEDIVDAPDGEQSAMGGLIPADVATPLDVLERRERVQRLGEAIQKLPEREKQIIVMYYYEELYMAEMAELLGISESRVSQLHTRALYNLTRMLEER